MTRLRCRPAAPAATPAEARAGTATSGGSSGRSQHQVASATGQTRRRAATGGASVSATRPEPPAKSKAAPADRIRPNLFISPVLGRARARTSRKPDPVKATVRPAAGPADKTSSRARARTEPTRPTARPAATPGDRTPSRARARTQPTKPTARPAATPGDRTPSRSRPKTGQVPGPAKPTATSVNKTPSRAQTRKDPELDAAKSTVRPSAAPAGQTPGRGRPKPAQKPAGRGGERPQGDASRAAVNGAASRATPVKRPVTRVRPSPASQTAAVAADGETPSKRRRLSARSPKTVTFGREDEAPSPSRFTAIAPRPPPPDALSATLPAGGGSRIDVLPATDAATKGNQFPAAATPRRHRLPQHVTSTPCGPSAPPPAADTADTCYGFLEDMEEVESPPLEQMVSPVGVGRARPPPPPLLRDATNLPSRFNSAQLARKAGGARPEVTTTVASQLMDPEVTFSKPASRSYSRRHVTAGHSTLGQSTLGSEESTTADPAGETTRSKPRRHRKKERDEELKVEMEQWAASMNSRLSEVDDFELLVEHA